MVVAAPIISLGFYFFTPDAEVWHHLVENLLAEYFINSLLLCSGTALLAGLLGSSSAWLCTHCDFPGRAFFKWALVLPLAYPGYVIAYTYTSMLDYGGVLHNWLTMLNLSEPLPIRSLGGAVFLLAFVLYPYVYILSYIVFRGYLQRSLEAGRMLGASPQECFFRLSLPIARPAVVAGMALVAMETLGDYGVVQYFGIPALSSGILKAWFGLNSLGTAIQLSLILLGVIFLLLALERVSRRRARFEDKQFLSSESNSYMTGKSHLGATFYCGLVLSLGFVIPTVQLLFWVFENSGGFSDDYIALISNTLYLATMGALLVLLVSLILSYSHRIKPGRILGFASETVVLGYAVPGVVIAVGVLAMATILRNVGTWLNIDANIWENAGIALLLLALLVRFLIMGFNPLQFALQKIPLSVDESAKSLGSGFFRTFFTIHLPLVKNGVCAAFLLAFVEIVKELPATLILRPYNFDTLAVRTFEFASDERLTSIAAPALTIVLVGLLPIAIVIRSLRLHKHRM